jgi:uracil-DNA glycosylase
MKRDKWLAAPVSAAEWRDDIDIHGLMWQAGARSLFPHPTRKHCHPPKNRKSLPEWIEKCSPYLHSELEIVQPRLVIGLGRDAEAALQAFYPQARVLQWPFIAPRANRSKTAPYLLFAKHPSWIKRQHDVSLEQEYVTSLVRALKWGFRDVEVRKRARTQTR